MFLKRKLIQQISKEGQFKETAVLRKAHACNISVGNSYGGKFTLLTQLMKSNYLLYCFVSVVPEGNGRGG